MDPSAIDGLLERAVDDGVLPGVVAVAGDRAGVLYEGAFGVLSVQGDTAVRSDTMFWLASMTKALVSVGALQLIEQGELDLEQPVADILPEFGALQVLDGFDGSTPRLRAPKKQATIRHLLTHTAGAGYWFANGDILRYHQLTGVPDPASGKLASLFDVPLIADPGTRWEYGTNTDWLGRVVEGVSGQNLASFCAEHIFGPLAMPDTTFTANAEQSSRMMTVHSRIPDGGLMPSPLGVPADAEFFSAGAGASGTGLDYLRFMRAMLRGGELDGERVLRPETVELAFTDHLQGAPLPRVIRSAIPMLSNDVPAWPVSQGWGLGFRLVLEDIPAMRRAGTGDWAGLANCYFWIDRATGIGGAFLTQVLPFYDARIVETALGFEQSVYALLGATVAT
ncbi:MAG: methyl acetate hydrolase [Solirubrobacteraceae bacterium]|jgi:CubicO group peptidase (beta-lactamase class C family)|nr:methyl acetate hydrolase [Solirubrobacteraceae bacterium]